MSAPVRRPVVPKLGSSFLTRQLSLQSPTPPIQPQTQQHRKPIFRRQSSEDLSLRRGRRRGRDTPPATPSEEKGKSRDSSATSGAEKRAHTAPSDNSDVRWRGEKQNAAQNTDTSLPVPPGLFNRHFPQNKDAAVAPGSGPVGGRPITPGRSRPVRVAWAEKRSVTIQPAQQQSDPAVEIDPEEDLPVEVVARKVGQPKPVTGSVIKAKLAKPQQSLPCIAGEKDSVFQTRQQLADKLRRAWWGEDQLRPNLDIFLSCAMNDNLERTSSVEEASKEEREEAERNETREDPIGKIISIKIDTSTANSNSSSTESSEKASHPEQTVLRDREGCLLSKFPPRGPNVASQISPHSLPQTEVTAKGGDTQTKACPSNETKASSSSHAAGNEFSCGFDVRENPKEDPPSGGGSLSKASNSPFETKPQTPTPVPATPSHPPSASNAPLASAPTPVTNGGSVPSQTAVGKNAAEAKKEVVVIPGKQQTSSGSEGKVSGASNASMKRAQFRSSSFNRRTITRSAEANSPSNGTEKASASGALSAATNAGQAASAVPFATTSSRLSGALSGSLSNVSEGGTKAREDAAKGKKMTQQGQEIAAAERNPWKRNADSAGITRASTIDMGESSQASGVEGGALVAGTVQARPSTALRSSDRSTLRSSASFVTTAAARHRQKTSTKRRVLRRSTDDDEGAEGEGGADEVPKGGGGPRGKGGVRGALADVVTMVSLVSPTGSDTEEPLPEVFSFPRDPAVTAPAVPTPVAISSRGEGGGGRRGGGLLSRVLSVDALPERSTQRKLHKSVSFQSDSLPEEDCFTRRPAFPASLLIPRISSASNIMSSAAPEPPSPSPCSSQPPVAVPSASSHVPKIVNPATRNSYSPPEPPPPVARNSAERQTTVAAVETATPERVAAVGLREEDSSTAGRLNRKRVMFRTRSGSLRGSVQHNEEQEEIVGGGDKSSLVTIKNGKNDGGNIRVDGAASDALASSASAANASKQRGIVVILPERRELASTRTEDKAKSLRSGLNAGGSRSSTGIGSKGTNPMDKGKKVDEECGAEDDGKDQESKVPEFKSAKERECWELYQRMCEKGLSVSYDTILRGMLTPTEYRMRRNALLSYC